MVKNKKGFLRIVEACFSILIILGVFLILRANKNTTVEENFAETIPSLLEEIAKNRSMRLEVLNYETEFPHTNEENKNKLDKVRSFLRERIRNEALGIDVRICGLSVVCPIEPYPEDAQEMFSYERIISTDLRINGNQFEPKKIKVFVWKKY